MVVVLIIAILLAIAIPTFLGAQDRARDRGAQSDLRNALTAAKTIATDDAGLFSGITVASLTSAEGSLKYNSGVTLVDKEVSVSVQTTTRTSSCRRRAPPARPSPSAPSRRPGEVRQGRRRHGG
jgi:type II secretory pathway pseudopilin PulG